MPAKISSSIMTGVTLMVSRILQCARQNDAECSWGNSGIAFPGGWIAKRHVVLRTIVVLAVSAVWLTQPSMASSQHHQVTNLSTLGGTDGSYAHAINNAGQTVGTAATSRIVHRQDCTCFYGYCYCTDSYLDVSAGFIWSNDTMTAATADLGPMSSGSC
jgi:uncharacterized membrane protein